jgi:hypothetical protein
MTLAQDLTGDLPGFLDPDEFGTAATYIGYTISAGGRTAITKSINVIFDDAFDVISPITGEVELTRPQAIVRGSDTPAAEHDQTLTVNGTIYKIIGIRPEGTGLTVLILSKDAE